MEAQTKATKSLYDSIIATSVINIFDHTSYALPGMLKKLEWIHTWALDKPKNYRDPSQIKEEWDNIHDPIVVKNPKIIREGDCKRMKMADSTGKMPHKL